MTMFLGSFFFSFLISHLFPLASLLHHIFCWTGPAPDLHPDWSAPSQQTPRFLIPNCRERISICAGFVQTSCDLLQQGGSTQETIGSNKTNISFSPMKVCLSCHVFREHIYDLGSFQLLLCHSSGKDFAHMAHTTSPLQRRD